MSEEYNVLEGPPLDDTQKYYVYGHYIPDSNVPFLIGKGNGSRSDWKWGRTKWWKNVVKKYDGFDVRILYSNIDEYDALCLEILTIWAIGRRDLGTGPLVNMTAGGDGTVGRIPKEETRAIWRNQRKGNKHNLGKKRSIESRIQQGESRKKNKLVAWNKGILNPAANKAVKTPLGIFESVGAAAKAHNCSRQTIKYRSKHSQEYRYI